MDIEEILNEVRKEKVFEELSSLDLKKIELGEMEHKYTFSKNEVIYFIKELKNHEAQMEYFLTILQLTCLPYSNFPRLLKKRILVREFVSGEILSKRKIDLELLREFAIMRNKMNDKRFFDKYNIFKMDNYSQEDDGFYERGIREDLLVVKKIINEKRGLDKLKEIYYYVSENFEKILNRYLEMPFEKQHQDFREDNIIIDSEGRHRLIDWGSSYGYNPFLFDIAPFLIDDSEAFEEYINNSDVCKDVERSKLDCWLYSALAVRFLSMVRWRIGEEEEIAKIIERADYELSTYSKLLDFKF